MPVTREQAELAKEKARALIEADPVLRNANPSYGIAFVGDGFGVEINFQKSVVWDNILPPSLDGVLLQIQVVGKIGKFE